MNDEVYKRQTLLKLKRRFSEKETIQIFARRVEALELELGKMTSERDEALYRLEQQKHIRKALEAKLQTLKK